MREIPIDNECWVNIDCNKFNKKIFIDKIFIFQLLYQIEFLRFQNLKIGTAIKSFKLVLVCEFRKNTLVIPTYNESENIEKLIQELKV